MFAAVTQILPIANIRRMCVLPRAGQVIARMGAKVSAGDVVAELLQPDEHVAMDIRRGLKLASAAEAMKALTRQLGDTLEKEDIIAETHGMFARIMRAPAHGTIVFIGGGMVILRTSERKIQARAAISGTVVEIVPDHGVVIEENGALIQCAWGNGKIDSGVLTRVCENSTDVLTAEQIDVGKRGAVIFGGHCDSADVLRACAEVQLRGLILSSMRSALIEQAVSLAFPVLVVEGFGNIALNDAAFRLLSTNDRRDICLNAGFAPAAGQRPEMVIPLDVEGQPGSSVAYFAAGQIVRLTSAPDIGKTGTILQVRPGTVALPNGVRAPAADVQIRGDRRSWIPLANLEVLETADHYQK